MRRGQWRRSEIVSTRDRVKLLIPLVVLAVAFPLLVTAFPTPSTVRDAYSYTMMAERLAADGVYSFGPQVPGAPVQPNAVVTPGWPLALAGVYEFVRWRGDAFATARAAHPALLFLMFVFSAGTVLAVVLSARLLAGPNIGLAAGVAAALYPPISWSATVALAENMGACLFAWLLYVALRLGAPDSPRRLRDVAGFGALGAAVVLVRPNLLLWLVAPIAYVVLRRLESPGRIAALIGVAALGFSLVMAPWWIRNELAMGRFIAVKSASLPAADRSAASEEQAPESTGVVDDEYWERTSLTVDAVRFAQPWVPQFEVMYEESTNPGTPIITYPQKRHPSVALGNFLAWESLWFHRVILLFAAISLLFIRRSPRLTLLLAAPLAVLAVHFAHLTTRYLYPTMPALLIMATLGAYGLWLQARRILHEGTVRF